MVKQFELPTSLQNALDGRVAFSLQLAFAAGLTTLKYFRTDQYSVERKRDKSPVTAADKEAEQTARTMVQNAYPSDALLGEEFGTIDGESGYEWIIDPIDGTKSFISGVPLYSTLVGMAYRGEPLIGVIAIPALGELVIAAKGMGAWYGESPLGRFAENSPISTPLTPTSVSKQARLEDGLMVTSQSDNFQHRNAMDAFHRLEKTAYVTRTWGDGYGYLLVATGRAEVMIDPIVNPWDIAAVAPVIQEAGGMFSSWTGQYSIRASHCFGSNGRVHEQVLRELEPYAGNSI